MDNSTDVLYANADLGGDSTHFITLRANITDPTSQILGLDRAIVESSLSNGYIRFIQREMCSPMLTREKQCRCP